MHGPERHPVTARGARRRGFTLYEMIVYLTIFSIVSTMAGVAIGQAYQVLNAATLSATRHALVERSLQRIVRDIRNARRTLPAMGAIAADARTLILEMPPASPGERGEVVVYAFGDVELRRGRAAAPERPVTWTQELPDVDPGTVTFATPAGGTGPVRVRIACPAGREPVMGERVWECVATPRNP